MIDALKNIFLKQKTGFFAWFFVFYAILGFSTLGDYGVHYDELTQRAIGMENARYLSGRESELEKHRFFGPLFETTAHLAEQVMPGADIRSLLLLRRGLLFSVFLLSIIGVYRVGLILYKSLLLQFTVPFLYAMWPRMFAEAHYNSKDVFFLCLTVFAIWSLFRPSGKWALIWPFIFCGFAMSIRLSGVFVFVAALPVLYEYSKKDRRKWLLLTSQSLAVTFAAFLLVFPALWYNPPKAIFELFKYSSQNPWPSPTVLAGVECAPGNVPGYYTLLWMLVTLPIGYWLFFVLGLFKKTDYRKLSILLLFFIPLLYTFLMAPTFYNGWRHMYFLYLPFVLIMGYGLELADNSFENRYNYSIASCIVALVFFVFSYKTGYVYFNISKTNIPAGYFSMDYWGVSTLDAIKTCLRIKQQGKVKIYSFTETAALNARLLSPAQRKRIQLVNQADSADFVIVLNREGKVQKYPQATWSFVNTGYELVGKDTMYVIYRMPELKR